MVQGTVDAAVVRPAGRRSDAPVSVVVIGATGYVGGELVRLLHGHPQVRIVGLQGRDRSAEPVELSHRHLASTGYVVDAALPRSDAVFIALPHGQAAAIVPRLLDEGRTVIDLGADFRLRDPADYPRWYGLDHPFPELLDRAVYGLPELHRDELRAPADTAGEATAGEAGDREPDPVPRLVASPGCYPTATLLALAPLARAGLIGDLVVDAKSGVSGAGREPKPDLTFSDVNESVKAYGIGGHRHVAEIEQELRRLGASPDANPGARAVDFLPHLVPMTRGILSAGHVRPSRPVSAAELAQLYRDAYAGEPFVSVVDTPPTTKQVLGSNFARVHVSLDERTGRVLAIGVVDNLVKGAAGQAIQAFNVVFGLDETAGLRQLPLAP